MSVRVRFAPSPTGDLHAGGARTALFNFLFAKKQGGSFCLRVEDTDVKRNEEPYLSGLMQSLKWMGLSWDEGPKADNPSESAGEFGPYRQSQRQKIYQKYAEKLLNEGRAYYCFLTEGEIKALKEKNESHLIESPYREWSSQQALEKKQQGSPFVIRFKTPKEKKVLEINDLVRGRVSFSSSEAGDFILVRSNGMPMYNFCCVIDDALMKISHVLRAEEHLPNTLRQLLLFEALGFTPPQFGHLSIILSREKKKLSKREGAFSCLEYQKQGYLPEALVNFLALLGWNPKDEREIFSMKELIQNFSEKGLNSAGAVFDEEKLKWMNAQHLRRLSAKDLKTLLEPYFQKKDLAFCEENVDFETMAAALRSSFSNTAEAVETFSLFSKEGFKIDASSREILNWPHSKEVVFLWKKSLEERSPEFLNRDDFQEITSLIKKTLDVKGKFLFQVLRAAMIGRLQGLELKAIVPLLSRKTWIKRAGCTLNDLFRDEK